MATPARRFVCVVVALTVPSLVFAQVTSKNDARIAPNLEAGALQPTVERMWRSSPTFRAQCARLAAEPTLRVSLWIDPFHPLASERAHAEISRVRGRLTHADIVLFDARDAIELIAHELEHIIEQIDGVRLREAVCGSHHVVVTDRQSCRAIEMGKRVAAEVEETEVVRQ